MVAFHFGSLDVLLGRRRLAHSAGLLHMSRADGRHCGRRWWQSGCALLWHVVWHRRQTVVRERRQDKRRRGRARSTVFLQIVEHSKCARLVLESVGGQQGELVADHRMLPFHPVCVSDLLYAESVSNLTVFLLYFIFVKQSTLIFLTLLYLHITLYCIS